MAHTLAAKGLDFCLLEISDYFGGRMRSVNFQGLLVEEGANWIEGTVGESGKTNPIWELAQQVNLKTDKDYWNKDGNHLVLDQQGNDVT